MSRISERFSALKNKREGAYIPYVCAGDLGNEFTEELVEGLCSSGADLVELGLPFSDPVADGPTIQAAMKRSLDSGFRVADAFETVKRVRDAGFEQPIILMTYHNLVHKMRTTEFCKKTSDAGADGLLVVDLPPEESEEIDSAAHDNRLDVIRLVAPSTPPGRLRMIVSKASGFIYAVSVAGVTGERQGLPESAEPLIKRVTEATTLPVALGFGVSRPDHAQTAFKAGAAGVVEGSALISLYQSQDGRKAALASVMAHAASMKMVMR